MKNSYTSDFAKELRHNPTDAETRLWQRLKEMQPAGIRFRRQHPLGNYIVDFACIPAKLVIEVDGSQHMNENRQDYESKRTAYLESQGFRVLRFWDNDVLLDTESVAGNIFEAVQDYKGSSE